MANKRILKYKSSGNFNISLVLFCVIIIYVLFNIFSFLTKEHVAQYQVQQGTIASNNIYQGIIIRDETVEYSNHTGYINYYAKNGSKVAANTLIYSIDTNGTISNKIKQNSDTKDAISKENLWKISSEIDHFSKDYNKNQFSKSYTFLNNLNTDIAQSINNNALSDLSNEVISAEQNHTFYQIKTSNDGVIVYGIDGLENYTINELISEQLNYNQYDSKQLFNNTKVSKSDPVYKRINSEKWNILIPINDQLVKELEGNTIIKIRFCKDDFTTNATYEILKGEDRSYLNLSLNTAMIRYINDRFIDIELVMREKNGLKIPQSSITKKEFFTIPKEYFTKGGDSNKPALMINHIVDGKNTPKIIYPTLYYETEDYYYVDSEDVSEGDFILMPDSQNSYRIGSDKDSLEGVYNINKGYAVFKQITIIYENEEYAIVETKTAYGISLYDHIALDAKDIKENQLISK